MKLKTLLSCAVVSLCNGSLFAQSAVAAAPTTSHEDRLAALKSLEIEDGIISSVHRDEPPTQPASDGRPQDNLPPRTIVKALLQPAKGSNINIEIWLPDAENWNQRFVGLGNGGSAGRIHSEGLAWPLSSGYAVATTDMGTAPSSDSGVGNPEVWKDFGFRATHLMTLAAKQIIKAFYGDAPSHSYFIGGSTGGQQALQEAQRYPDDYNGIIAGVPAHCRTPLHAYFLWNDQILRNCPFTKEQEASVIAAGIEYMAPRETPPAGGKFISDPRCDGKDIEAVIALALLKDPTLTPQHAEALRKLFGGPKHAVTGERIFNGIPFGSSISASHGHLYLFKWVFGADKKFEDINFGADIDTYTATLGPYLNAENPDLSAFEKRGGKLIMTSGSADSIVPYHSTLDYYERVIEHFGSPEKVRSFFRFYIIPGMGHGGGPAAFQSQNLLTVLRNWHEKGIIPDMLPGPRVGKTEIPIFPYPTKPGWDAETSSFKAMPGPRGGIESVAPAFRPAASQ